MSARFPHPVALGLVLLVLVGAVGVLEFGVGSPADPAADAGTTGGPGAVPAASPSGASTSSGSGAGSGSADAAPPTTTLAPADAERIAAKEEAYQRAPEIASPTGFVNAQDVSIEQYRGTVVLVQFWTFGCINCQHTLPHVNAWYDEYADDGLVVVGVHTPEFDYEKQPENVRKAVAEDGIQYPVVLDNDWATWRAYGIRAWPTQVLIDADGYVRYQHVGEGRYDQTEREIQNLLAERNREDANRTR